MFGYFMIDLSGSFLEIGNTLPFVLDAV